MLTITQEVAGVKAAIDCLEKRIKRYRTVLSQVSRGESPPTSMDDVAITDGEIETVEGLIVALAKRATGATPQSNAWVPLSTFETKFQSRPSDNWADRTSEYFRWSLLWLQKTRVYLAYIAGIARFDAGKIGTAEKQ